MQDACVICEMDAALRDRSRELRDVLRRMNPITDVGYEALYTRLIWTDTDLRMLLGSEHKADA
jgi:hypothetical protein